jgi:predicted hydrocarbon binding protein
MSQSGGNAEARLNGTVAAAFPLALLEAVRSHDRPGEILEDEDVSVSLPRRLGLTGVVETQIQRYLAASRTGRQVPLTEALGLFRLVMRRPDAEPILRETGQRVGRWRTSRSPQLWLGILRRGPARLALRSARRSVVKSLKSLHAGQSVEATKPFTITVQACVTASIEDSGPACALFTGMMEEQLLLYTGKPHRVVHSRCSADGGGSCEWTLGA